MSSILFLYLDRSQLFASVGDSLSQMLQQALGRQDSAQVF